MLSYFPTPHPHEWMYSVYCRYYVRSGQTRRTAIIRELFPDRPHTAIGSLYPNSAILQVSAQLPNYPDARTLMLNHTLFLYHTRCFPAAKKEALITKLSSGTKTILGGIYRDRQLSAPRYCPLCVKDDRADYGEAYWHIEHQIPSMEICPKHECRLLHIDDIDFISVKDTFCPLDAQNLAPPSSYEKELIDKWKIQFSKVIYDYATLPLSFAATPGYSNLSIALGNMGYAMIHGCDIYASLDASRLYQDVKERYGSNFVSKIFSSEKAVHHIHQVCNWSSKIPEQYALLQCFSGINSSTAFSSTRLQSTYMADEEKIHCYQDECELCFSEHMSTWLNELHIEFLKIYTSSTDILVAPQDFLAKLAGLLVRADEEYCHVNMPEGTFREFISKMKQREIQAAIILLEQLLDGYQPEGKYSSYPNWTWDTGNSHINKYFGAFAIKQYFSVLANQVLRAKTFGF